MDGKFQNFLSFLATASPKRTFAVLGFLLVLLAIPFTANLSQQQQNLEQEAGGRNRFCADVLTPARNEETGECQTFPDSCIPENFKLDPTCFIQPTPTPPPSPSPSASPLPTPPPSPSVSPQPSPTPPPSPSAEPSPSPSGEPGINRLNLAIGLHGLGSVGDNANPDSKNSNKDPKNKSRNFTIEIRKSSNEDSTTTNGVLNYDGASGLFKGSVDLGTPFIPDPLGYLVFIKSPGYLKDPIPGVWRIAEGVNDQPSALNLITGDVNDDNVIDLLDYSKLISCSVFSKTVPDDCVSETDGINTSDLNDDGIVDQDDLALLLREWANQHGAEPPPGSQPSPTPSPISSSTKILCDGRTFTSWRSPIFEIGSSPDDNNPNIVKVIRNCIFKPAQGAKSIRPPISIRKGVNVLIEGNRFENIRTLTAGDGIHAIAIPGRELADGITIKNNFFSDIGADGIQIGDSGSSVKNVSIENNEFVGSEAVGENGVDIKSGIGPFTVKSNKIHGFRPCQSPNTNPTGTQDCSGSTGPGMVIHTGNTGSTPGNITLENNEFYDNTYGLNISGGAGITVRNNQFRNNLINALLVSGGTGISLLGNTYSGSGSQNCSFRNISLTCQ